MNKEELNEAWKYEFKAWALDSPPVELIHSQDHSESYEMDRKHVFKLENGQYALISESGCSCYEASDAQIILFPTEEKAKEAFVAKEGYGSWTWKQ